MKVNLPPASLADLARSRVACGLYTSTRDVVREALRVMDARDQLRQAKLKQLCSDVRQGLASRAHKTWNAESITSKSRPEVLPGQRSPEGQR